MRQNLIGSTLEVSCDIPFYLTNDYAPLFLLEHGKNQNKAIVISIPKSGTFLVAELLRFAEFVMVRMNVRKNSLRDFRWCDLNDTKNLDQPFPLEIVVKMITSGQLIAGHVEYEDYTKKVLKNFRKIFTYRNLRDCLVSNMIHVERWGVQMDDREMLRKMKPGPTKLLEYMNTTTMNYFLNNTKKIIGWHHDNDAFKISYEELMGDYGKERRNQILSNLFHFVDKNIDKNDLDDIINSTFVKDTLTKSGERTNINEYWNEQVESKFCELGFNQLNHQLGYN